jgi:uncharacterized cupredoxin-like copper-binding protein
MYADRNEVEEMKTHSSDGFKAFLLPILLAVALVTAIAVAACSDDSSEEAVSDEPAAEEHVDDADTHDDEEEHADDADDADAHDDTEEHADDAEEHVDDAAYLEAAPKEDLFLIDMSLFSYTPNVIEAGVGEVIEIAIQNSEAALHDFTIDEIDADVHISYLGGTGEHEHAEAAVEGDVHFALTEPASGVVHLKVHEPGEYVFYCSVPGHQEQGLEGKLIITEA